MLKFPSRRGTGSRCRGAQEETATFGEAVSTENRIPAQRCRAISSETLLRALLVFGPLLVPVGMCPAGRVPCPQGFPAWVEREERCPRDNFQGELFYRIGRGELLSGSALPCTWGVTENPADTHGSLRAEGGYQGDGRVMPKLPRLLFPPSQSHSTPASCPCHRAGVRRGMRKGQTSLSLPEALTST